MIRWLLFDGSRNYIAGGLLLLVFVTLLLLGLIWPIQYRDLLEETTMVQTVLNTLLSGVILLVSIVVSVASVGISQELTTIGDQAERIDTSIEFHSKLERRDEIDVSPARPGKFMLAFLRIIQNQADELEAIGADSALHREATYLAENIHVNIEQMIGRFNRVKNGTSAELIVGVDYECSWQLYQVRRLLTKYDTQLSDAERETLEDLEEILQQFFTTREYLKSMYYERELSSLSSSLLTVSLPVIIYITYVLLAIDAGQFPDVTVLGFSSVEIFISLSYTIALGPYVILTTYVFRAAIVTKWTPEAGPFVLDTDCSLPSDAEGEEL